MSNILSKLFKKKLQEKELKKISEKIGLLIDPKKIPVIVISYNNAVYVCNMVDQLSRYNIQPIIIDNNSTDPMSLDILKKLEHYQKAKIIYSAFNFGHKVGFLSPVYEALPDFFAYTDPDLNFSKDMPFDFLETMIKLTEEFNVFKVGCALTLDKNLKDDLFMNIDEINKPFKVNSRKFNIYEWESRYWKRKINHEYYELYSAPIDTTFAIYNKKYFFYYFYDAIRIGGNYSAIHLPWYPELDIMSSDQKKNYLINNISNTWKKK
ncbi:glycosyltransferase [Acinetobacter sp. ANC 4193]